MTATPAGASGANGAYDRPGDGTDRDAVARSAETGSASGLVTTVDGSAAISSKELRRRARAWAMWDVGNSAWQAVIVTFVFATYLASDLFLDPAIAQLAGSPAGSEELRLYTAAQAQTTSLIANLDVIAALLVAFISPALGARSDSTGKRKRWLIIFSVLTIAVMLAMFFVFPDQSFLLFGAGLLAVGVVFSEFSGVSYDAMLSQVSTQKTVGRTSGMGWGLGYIGSIVLLLILLVFFIQSFGVEGRAGIFGIPAGADGDGLNVRIAIVAAAIWFALFLIPVIRRVPENTGKPNLERRPWWHAYVVLWRTVRTLARREPKLLLFLIASAIYRDGLATVFGFGAILAAQVYGFAPDAVIYFAVAANLVAGVGTIAAGWFDDRFSPKAVIMLSLVSLVLVAALLFVLPNDQIFFWIFGLFLCLFVGPVQAASRSYLMRATPVGHEGELFGLYRTTGRAASFLTPALISLFLALSGDPKLSIVAIGIVLLAGLVLFLPVRKWPTRIAIDNGDVALTQITIDEAQQDDGAPRDGGRDGDAGAERDR